MRQASQSAFLFSLSFIRHVWYRMGVCAAAATKPKQQTNIKKLCVGKVLTLSDWQFQLCRPQYKVQCSLQMAYYIGRLLASSLDHCLALGFQLCFTLLYFTLLCSDLICSPVCGAVSVSVFVEHSTTSTLAIYCTRWHI